MKQIRIELDTAALKRAEAVLGSTPKKFTTAVNRSINRALMAGRTKVVKSTAEKFSVRSSDVRAAVKIFRSGAQKSGPGGEIRLSGQNLPLRAFKHTPRAEDTTGAKRRVVSVSMRRQTPQKLGKAFKWRGHIFERTGIWKSTAANPRRHETIKKRFGVSVPGMAAFASHDVKERMKEVFENRLDHEVQVILEGRVK